MGEVYRATDIVLGRDVAIKLLPPVDAHLGRLTLNIVTDWESLLKPR